MKEENCIIECDDEALRGEVFSLADIPECWEEGDFIGELDHSDILDVLYGVADNVELDVFEDGMPGGSGTFYQVYASNIKEFKKNLSEGLITLLTKTYGEIE